LDKWVTLISTNESGEQVLEDEGSGFIVLLKDLEGLFLNIDCLFLAFHVSPGAHGELIPGAL